MPGFEHLSAAPKTSDDDWLRYRDSRSAAQRGPVQRAGMPRGAGRGPTRRVLLGGAVGGAGLSVAGWGASRLIGPEGLAGKGVIGSGSGAHASCVEASALAPIARIGSASIVYDPTGQATSMRFDASFLGQLHRWKADFDKSSRYGGTTQVWSFGAHVLKDDCHSWHANGRAFDISRLRIGGRTVVSAREDLWSTLAPGEQAAWRRRYWTLAASLHLHFAYVLTHHFDVLHRNHLHVDNGVSGSGISTFDESSTVQNQAVQAICAVLWGRPGEVTGEWSDSRERAGPVLDALGLEDLRRQQDWQAFLRASVARG